MRQGRAQPAAREHRRRRHASCPTRSSRKVVKTRKPLIVSDALHDDEFKNALSVVNLKLSSVMCVPLLERGDLLGLIYVGNDNVAQLFEETHLRGADHLRRRRRR